MSVSAEFDHLRLFCGTTGSRERGPDDLLQHHGAVSAAQRAVQQQPVEDDVVMSYDDGEGGRRFLLDQPKFPHEHRNRQSPPSAEKGLREAASQAESVRRRRNAQEYLSYRSHLTCSKNTISDSDGKLCSQNSAPSVALSSTQASWARRFRMQG
jgi:hypothetical protein